MIIRKNYLYVAFCFFILAISCSENGTKKEKNKTTPIDSLTSKNDGDAIYSLNTSDIKIGSSTHRTAIFLAGLKQPDDSFPATLQNSNDWKNYSKNFDSLWKHLDAVRLNKQKQFAKTETYSASEKSPFLFYPFSGADFLNAQIFFPSSKRMMLIGLEPAGTIPDINKMKKDTIEKYFNMIRRTLKSIVQFSFFRTNSMAKDFHNDELDGTLPITLIFIARTGNSITAVEALDISNNGELVATEFKGKKKHRGYRITYIPYRKNYEATIDYISADLSNNGLQKDSSVHNLISALNYDAVFLKSASYLMYKPWFSTIRKSILSKAKYLLQDDSGIPFKYFKKGWKAALYGTYDKPIKLFENHFQKDFYKAYHDSDLTIKPLPFGIGYDWHEKESNLMLAEKITDKK